MTSPIRELLFGDVPLAQWAGSSKEQPWSDFQAARDAIARGDPKAAIRALESVVSRTGLESRHYLQAWSTLRELGAEPPASQAKRVLGVVLDMPVSGGLDTLAAYEDGSARYLNFSGKGIVWDATDPAVEDAINRLIATGTAIAKQIGPWKGERPPLPEEHARISLLTPSGIHFGQAPARALLGDPLAGPAFAIGGTLMKTLIDKTLPQ